MGALFEPFVWLLSVLVDLYFSIVVVQIVIHWLLHFKVIDVKNKYAQITVNFLAMATEPVYNKIRGKIPAISGIDIAPFALVLALLLISRFLYRLSILLM